jgi:hypothetical protein
MKDESFDRVIEMLKHKVEVKEKELIDAKKAVNQFCVLVGENPAYDIDESVESSGINLSLKGHEYYMQPLAKVINDILKRANGPATIKEIYDQMVAGGYKFDAKNDDNAQRGVRISVMKNVAKFHKLPNGKFGLTEWFPELKESKEPKKIKRRKRKHHLTKTIKQEGEQSLQQEESVVVPKRLGRPPKVKTQEEPK